MLLQKVNKIKIFELYKNSFFEIENDLKFWKKFLCSPEAIKK